VGEETMKETTAAEINVGGRLRWVVAAMINLGARDPAVSNGYTCESSSAKEKWKREVRGLHRRRRVSGGGNGAAAGAPNW
jgi:hypothetical protein